MIWNGAGAWETVGPAPDAPSVRSGGRHAESFR